MGRTLTAMELTLPKCLFLAGREGAKAYGWSCFLIDHPWLLHKRLSSLGMRVRELRKSWPPFPVACTLNSDWSGWSQVLFVLRQIQQVSDGPYSGYFALLLFWGKASHHSFFSPHFIKSRHHNPLIPHVIDWPGHSLVFPESSLYMPWRNPQNSGIYM